MLHQTPTSHNSNCPAFRPFRTSKRGGQGLRKLLGNKENEEKVRGMEGSLGAWEGSLVTHN